MQTRVADTYPATSTTGAATAVQAPPRISWGAVLAGALVAVTVGAMLNLLGLAVGFTAVEPPAAIGGTAPSAATFGVAGGIWLLVANLIGLATGGYVAARFSGTHDDTDGVLHGLSVWAIAFVISALLLGNVVAGAAGSAVSGVSSILGGAAQGATQAAGSAAGGVAGQLDPQQLMQQAQASLRTGGDPAAMSSEARNAEMGQILLSGVTAGQWQPQQRERLQQLVAAEYGISPEEAGQRISQVETEARQRAATIAGQAREAATTASNAAAAGAYWLFAAMLLGAVASVLGARTGTRSYVAARRTA